MSIYIKKVIDKYTAIVTPPHGNNFNWESDEPMTSDELVKELLNIGCHQTDIGDAFFSADPNWLNNTK